MGKEIERKFLVRNDSYKELATASRHIVQAYLNTDPDATVRLRVADGQGFITVKSRSRGCERGEWEYAVPAADVAHMMDACAVSASIDKTRWLVPAPGGLLWEVDEFHGALAPLVVAEIELPAPDAPLPCPLPEFIGREVTDDPRYCNSSLAASSKPL